MQGRYGSLGRVGVLSVLVGVAWISAAGCRGNGKATGPTDNTSAALTYPPARADAAVIDDYHGTNVPDPYRWMENADAPETVAWSEAQNKITADFVNGPKREAIRERLTKMWNFERYSLPRRKGDFYFFRKNDGLQNQSVLYVQKGLDGEPRVLLDPNKLSEDGTISLGTQSYTTDGKLFAYGLSQSGSDRQTIHVRDVETGKDLPDKLPDLRFPSVAWVKDNTGFYYNRYPAKGTVPELEEAKNAKLYYHKLGTPMSDDKLVLERPDRPELDIYPDITDDGRFLIAYVYEGTDPRTMMYVKDLVADGPFVHVVDKQEAQFGVIDSVGDVLYTRTTLDASRAKIIAIDFTKPQRENWKVIVPETADSLAWVGVANDQLIAGYLHDAYQQMKVYALDGRFIREFPLPGIGSVGEMYGRRQDSEMFYSYTSYLTAPTVYRYDFKSGQTSVFRQPKIPFDASGYETKQIFATSKDGTKVPVFVTHKKGLKLDGSAPAVLEGYGGFNVSITPYFSIPRLVWLEAGGVYAEAVLRGGEEYGEDWHQAGMLDRKQNVFDDFQAAAKKLIDDGYTNPKRLAIQGGSNGGLLVAACMLQKPELFGAIVCEVPVTDMLRYHKFTVGRFWIPEYGSSDDPAQFKTLIAYSPLHNVKPGEAYPPILVTTADTDDRVSPCHAKKFVATLQSKAPGKNPMLLRVETKAGHGAGKPTAKLIDENADVYAFLFRVFGM